MNRDPASPIGYGLVTTAPAVDVVLGCGHTRAEHGALSCERRRLHEAWLDYGRHPWWWQLTHRTPNKENTT